MIYYITTLWLQKLSYLIIYKLVFISDTSEIFIKMVISNIWSKKCIKLNFDIWVLFIQWVTADTHYIVNLLILAEGIWLYSGQFKTEVDVVIFSYSRNFCCYGDSVIGSNKNPTFKRVWDREFGNYEAGMWMFTISEVFIQKFTKAVEWSGLIRYGFN